MRSIRKAALDDVSALASLDRDFASRGREEFVRGAAQKGYAFVLEQDGQIIGLGVLEYTFFEQGFYLVGLCDSFRTSNRSRRNVAAVFGFYLQNPEAFFFHQPKQRAHASAIHEGRLRIERRDS